MLDGRWRTSFEKGLRPVGVSLRRTGITADHLTALGALIHLRNIPSIVVTLGMSFVWQGLAILLLPKPGGGAPDWLLAAMAFKPPFVPLPIGPPLIVALLPLVGGQRVAPSKTLASCG